MCIVKVHRAQWPTRSIAWLWFWIFPMFSFFTFSAAYGTPVSTPFVCFSSVQFCSVAQSGPTLCNPMECSMLGFLVHHSFWGLLKLMYIELVMPSNYFILCHPLLLLPSIFPSIMVFSNVPVLHIKRQKDWSFSFSISSSNEYSELISFRIDWLDLLAVQGTLKSLLQHHS